MTIGVMMWVVLYILGAVAIFGRLNALFYHEFAIVLSYRANYMMRKWHKSEAYRRSGFEMIRQNHLGAYTVHALFALVWPVTVLLALLMFKWETKNSEPAYVFRFPTFDEEMADDVSA